MTTSLKARSRARNISVRILELNWPQATVYIAQRQMHRVSGRGAAWLAYLTGGQVVAGSNPAAPTMEAFLEHQTAVTVGAAAERGGSHYALCLHTAGDSRAAVSVAYRTRKRHRLLDYI